MERIKQALNVARSQREELQNEYITSADRVGNRDSSTFMPEKNRLLALKGNYAKLLLAAVIIMSAMIYLWKVSGNDRSVTTLSGIEESESQQAIAARSTAFEMMEMKIAALTGRVNLLTESITRLETKLINIHSATDAIITVTARQPATIKVPHQPIARAEQVLESLPPTASDITEEKLSEAIAPRLSPDETNSNSSVTQEDKDFRSPVTTNETALKTGKSGPWVINIASTSSKADADRLVKKALSKDIHTEQQQITVKDTPFWRVQITGFSTADEARAYADTAKKQLGLKDVWIMKR